MARDAAQKIATFLTANGWNGSLSADQLHKSTPSTTTVVDIITFLMQLIDPLGPAIGEDGKDAGADTWAAVNSLVL